MASDSRDLYAGLFAYGPAASELGDAAWLRAFLDVEVALARSLARARIVSDDAARGVAAAAVPSSVSLAALERGAALAGSPIPALLNELRPSLPPDASAALHHGVTSQDVIDSAMMLMAKRALAHVLSDLAACAEAAAELAQAHRDTTMLGRTLLQHAVPITFGFKAAGWLWSIDDARARLSDVQTKLPLQFGGAAGTLALLGDRGVEVARFMAAELALREPVLPWHTLRAPVLDIANASGVGAVALGKIARDVTLLAQSDVGELREAASPGRGASSTLPHKRNPVGSIAVLACARRVPALVSTMLGAAEQEHERAAGAWHAEWETLTELLRLLGSAARHLREVLSGLEVDAERMRANLESARGLPFAERVQNELAQRMDQKDAEALVHDALARAEEKHAHLRDVLLGESDFMERLVRARVVTRDVASWFEPASYLGSSAEFIDRALSHHIASKIE